MQPVPCCAVGATAIIPAWNEEATVATVIEVARQATLVDEVLVVDNGSLDSTAAVARDAGARVVTEPTAGKGEAMRTGVASATTDVVVFLDADLVGLTPDHVDGLVAPVLDGRAAMTCGLFDRGSVQNPIFLHCLPILTGQRALRRELFEALDPEELQGWRVEAALNSLARLRRLPVTAFVCPGLWHRTKEEKSTHPIKGFVSKVGMLASAAWSYLAFWVRRAPNEPRMERTPDRVTRTVHDAGRPGDDDGSDPGERASA